MFAIPFVRSQPESVHKFALSLADWQRILLTFLLCVLLAHSLLKLFSPRLCHLKHGFYHPPTWLAWLIGGIIVAGIDLAVALSPTHYTASAWEWVVYGLGAILLVSVYRWLTALSSEQKFDRRFAIEAHSLDHRVESSSGRVAPV